MSGLVWVLVVPFAAWAGLRVTGVDVGWWWVALVAFTPYVAAASLVVLLLAGLSRRWAPAVVALAASVALAAAVLPRQLADTAPPAGGPSLRVLAANLLVGAADTEALLRLVGELKPDVVALQELTPAAKERLESGGLRKGLPHVVDRSHNGVTGSGIYSRYPLTEQPLIVFGRFRQARAAIRVTGGPVVEITSVHPCAPSHVGKAPCWRAGLDALPRAGGPLRVLAGDFNATLDHWPIRDLLDSGYQDAADVTGRGFTATWPEKWWDGLPGVAIDHVLADRRIAVRAFSVHALPASDHRPVFAELRLP